MADIEVNVESTNRQIDINLSSPSDIDTSTKERGPAGSSGSSGTDGSSGTSGTSGSSGIDGNFAGASFEYNFLTNVTKFIDKNFNDYENNYWYPHKDFGYTALIYFNKSLDN